MNDYKELLGDIGDCLIAQPSEAVCKRVLQDAANAIEQLVNDRNASVDAVPVVRCRDCEHARKLKDNFYGWDFSCKHFNSRWVRSNDFCSYGERKDEVSEC